MLNELHQIRESNVVDLGTLTFGWIPITHLHPLESPLPFFNGAFSQGCWIEILVGKLFYFSFMYVIFYTN